MSRKQGSKTTKSIQIDSVYDKEILKPHLENLRISFSHFARELIIKELESNGK